ncbi:MAG: hypothetical protein OEV20_06555, partial [Actinomycetota bacterium]|nr:hypothetical protein [Actinomycetota bacterium]
MPNDRSFFINGAQEFLDPGIDFVREVAKVIDGGGDDVRDRIVAALKDGDVLQELLGDDVTTEVVSRILGFAEKFGIDTGGVESLVEQLTQPVSSLQSDDLAWGWTPGIAASIPAGEVAVQVTAGVDVGAKLSWDEQLGFDCHGAARVGGSVTIPFKYGSFGARGATSSRIDLAYRFDHESDTLLYQALAKDLPLVIAPLAPDRLVGEGAATLASARLAFQGEVQLGATLTVGRSFAATRSVQTPLRTGETTELGISGQAGLDYSVDWSRAGRHSLTLTPKGARLGVRLEDASESELNRSLAIGANMRISGLDKVVVPVIERFGHMTEQVAGYVERFSDPSDLLRDELERRLPEATDLIAELGEIFGEPEKLEPVIGELSDVLVETVSARADRWTDVLERKTGSWLDEAIDRIVPDAFEAVHGDAIREQLDGLLGQAGAGLQQTMTEELSTLLATAEHEVVEAVGAIGERVDALIGDLEDKARQLLEPMRALVTRARRVRELLLDAVEATTREELGLKFVRTVNRKKGSSTLLELDLDPTNSDARTAYYRMLRGDFTRALALAREGNTAVVLEGGSFSDFLSYEKTQGVTINLFGLTMEQGSLLTSDLIVEYDTTGTISVFKATADYERHRKFLGESQSVRISSALNLVGTGDRDAAVPFSLKLSYSDEDLEKKEIRRFLNSIESVGLMRGGVTDDVVVRYNELGRDDDRGERALTVDLVLPLTGEDIDRIASKPAAEVIRTAVSVQIEMISDLVSGADHVLSKLDSRGGALTYILGEADRDAGKLKRDINGLFGGPRNRVHTGSNKARRLIHFVDRMYDNAVALQAYIVGMAELRALPLPEPDSVTGRIDQRTLEHIEERQRDLVSEL